MTRCVRVYGFKSHFGHRWPKLTMRGVIFLFFLFTVTASVQRNVTCAADIYYYITTGLNTRNVSRLAAALSKSGFVSEEGHSGCRSQNIAFRASKGNVLCQIWLLSEFSQLVRFLKEQIRI